MEVGASEQDIERMWYDSFENSVGGFLHNHISLIEGISQDFSGQSVGFGKNFKGNLRRYQGNVDNQRWELNRLGHSGAVAINTLIGKSDEFFVSDLADDNYKRIHLIVNSVVPPFLLGHETLFQRNDLENPISIVKDLSSDLAKQASRGSATLRNLKEQEDKNNMKHRFWELSGSKMGTLVGIDIYSKDKVYSRMKNIPHSMDNSKISRNNGKGYTEALNIQSSNIDTNEILDVDYKKHHDNLTNKDKNQYSNNSTKSTLYNSDSHYKSVKQTNTSIYNSEYYYNAEINDNNELYKASYRDMQQVRKTLPVFAMKEELLNLIYEHPIVVVVGETGSGKTTQLTQYLYEAGYSNYGIIACTQPRRVAAVSVAKRVSEEMNVKLGTKVGYTIRFEDLTSKETVIKYMTDGVLMRESLTDPELERYSVVIMDEAHERSLSTDVLFGIFKSILRRRRDFRLIVTSATMDSDKFSNFFGRAPIFEIPGRTFPVTIQYLRTQSEDYIESVVRQCLQIHCSDMRCNLQKSGNSEEISNGGDILIFMTGQEDIEATCWLIAEKMSFLVEDGVSPLLVLPIYSQLPSDLQIKIFQPSIYRKVIVATNIAETSLTLQGIRFVIDCGFCKVKVYNPKIGMDSLQVVPISQANAQQRSGRAGRTAPGICYRMYTEKAFLGEMLTSNIPEIQRTNLANVVLLLKTLGFNDILSFPFMDAPSESSILTSLYQLWSLGALDDDGNLTNIGNLMAKFPLDPPLAKTLITASELNCISEIIVIVAILSVPTIFFRPRGREEESDATREKFVVPESDHLTLLNVYLQWKRHNYNPKWCEKHFLHHKALKKAQDVFYQIKELYLNVMKDPYLIQKGISNKYNNLIIESHEISTSLEPTLDIKKWDNVRKSICSGCFHNSAKIRGIGEYVNLRTSMPAYLHPSSSLYNCGYIPDYIVYHEVIVTVKEYMNTVTSVEPEWLNEVAPKLFSLSTSNLNNNRKSDSKTSSYELNHIQVKEFKDIDKESLNKNSKRQNVHLDTQGLQDKKLELNFTKRRNSRVNPSYLSFDTESNFL
ncbi:pre-mRNA-splicing factor ATP-dependent RNA helicase PRP16, putative [Cryptosporidium muris RN66]|uniref:RNA helicase n=1 Tax=Cryptosporidium muris (strain RN66) TaxID=441375 RepID=B6AHK6_CRYMR|nr:pre-mRNA-splicing factor ATP-dependent RNA helicase PRP16, putative [Cryptosporidium muris RN66]EEA07701.1 pre-mRNA-splicing factor ATP-dependent RNA helicase PRP16, putative [Cryptosporidium muris RN66]|eukprot:XP_002142050.1 pre-mRNA-splicing factor ATP-dependent RNA helicase PRP16 [Cryptosporidium muris RN66]